MSNEEESLKQRLVAARIPQYVWKTSLAKEGMALLRKFVQEKQFWAQGTCAGMFLSPLGQFTAKEAVRVRVAFYLLAKEMTMLKVGVTCTDILELAREVPSYEVSERMEEINGSSFVFVDDFCAEGRDFPLSATQAYFVEQWLSSRIRNGKGIVAASDIRRDYVSYWSPRLLVELGGTVLDILVPARGDCEYV